jgi:hypothetical protein
LAAVVDFRTTTQPASVSSGSIAFATGFQYITFSLKNENEEKN